MKDKRVWKKPRVMAPVVVAAEVRRQVGNSMEKKNIDADQTNTLVVGQTTAVLKLLNPCAQGVTTVTRAGRRIMMTSLLYNWVIGFAPTTTGSSPLRLVIVVDKQANGAAPTAAQVFAGDQIDSPMNLDFSRRFKILVDVKHDGISLNGNESCFISGFRDFSKKPGGGIPVEFKNTSAGDITDIESNSVYSFVYSNGGFAVAAPTNSLYTRIRFTDA